MQTNDGLTESSKILSRKHIYWRSEGQIAVSRHFIMMAKLCGM